MALVTLYLALPACVLGAVHGASSCPSTAGSVYRQQVDFQYFRNSGAAEAGRELMPIGQHKARIPEASDALSASSLKVDGADGDVQFQFGNLKPVATVGEVDYKTGMMIVGVPDGMGAYLADDTTVRCVVQSESYGPISRYESYPYLVNYGAAAITGSHVQFVDYDREMMSHFMSSSLPASSMVKGSGELIHKMYNLRGELVGARNRAGATTSGAMDSNVDKDGNYVLVNPHAVGGVAQREADWTMQSLCSAHLAEKRQWGANFGFEDDVFLTNEEWITLNSDNTKMHIGLPAHAIDIATRTSYAVGALTVSGFEKIVEFKSGHMDYVVLAVSGYNGAITNHDAILAAKRASGVRPDGTNWVWPQNIHPARIYIGKKGYNATGHAASDFLSRNGLAYGQMYGFAVDSSNADFADRDAWHQTHYNGATMPGKFYPIDWRWSGRVENFDKDGAWHFQIRPKNGAANYVFWNAAGNNAAGKKTEHCSPNPDPAGGSSFFQSSTAGYFGKYDISGLPAALTTAASNADPFPTALDATYSLYQGETDIHEFVDLGQAVKGQTANGMNQTTMCDSDSCSASATPGKKTFEDIDGLDVIQGSDGALTIIQEDGGNRFGERMFIYRNALTYGQTPTNRPFKFVAHSGGKQNSRNLANVGVPAGSNDGADSHEFSGIEDLSAFFVKSGGVFTLKATDAGHRKRELAKTVSLRDKLVLIGLQAHNMDAGIISKFNADRGGQWLLYRPRLEGDGVLPQETTAASAQYKCNPFVAALCTIHISVKAELDAACAHHPTVQTPSPAAQTAQTPSPTAQTAQTPSPTAQTPASGATTASASVAFALFALSVAA